MGLNINQTELNRAAEGLITGFSWASDSRLSWNAIHEKLRQMPYRDESQRPEPQAPIPISKDASQLTDFNGLPMTAFVEALPKAFSWADSSEGAAYWASIHTQIKVWLKNKGKNLPRHGKDLLPSAQFLLQK